jgi:hypothetical protein
LRARWGRSRPCRTFSCPLLSEPRCLG